MVGMVHEEITLSNDGDLASVKRGHIKESEVRQMTVTAVVDTGAATLVISEAIQKALGLRTETVKEARLENGERVVCQVAETVEVRWKNRFMACRPLVVPGAKETLLGAIPLEDMDLMVDPTQQRLVGVHGEEEMGYLY
jgi:clan AA aspartic protease